MLGIKHILIFLFALQAEAVTFAGLRIKSEYVTGTAPTGVLFSCSFSANLGQTDVVKLITDSALFLAAETTGLTVAIYDNTMTIDTTKLATAQTDVNGMVEVTLSTGITLASGSVWNFLITGSGKFVTALPAAGTIQAYVQATGLTDSAASPGVAAMDIVAAPTVTLNSVADANLNAGSVPPGVFAITFDMPYDTAAATGKIKVIASQEIFGISQTSGLTQSGMTITGYTSSGDGFDLEIDYSAQITRGQAITLQCATPLLGNVPGVNLQITVDVSESTSGITPTSPHYLAKSLVGYGTVVNGVAAGSDPVARFGDRELEFQLPPRVLTPLLQAPDVKVFGSVFEGSNADEQWFDRIVLTTPQEDRFLQVKMKQNLQDANRSKAGAKSFHTMDVTLGIGSPEAPSHVTVVPQLNTPVPVHFLGHETVFRRVRRQATVSFTSIGSFPRECVDLAGSWMHFYVCSAPAAEYFGHQRDLSMRYAHLDLLFVEIIDFKKLTGLLPELWGVQPMTELTRSYVKNETNSSNASLSATAGGIGVENLEKCIEGSESFASDMTVTV